MTTVESLSSGLNQFLKSQPEWSQSSRREAFARFQKQGFPLRQNEDWKYTDLSPLRDRNFNPASAVSSVSLKYHLLSVPGPRLVFVNGFYSEKHSELADFGSDITVGSWRAASSSSVQRISARLQEFKFDDALSDLNETFASDGALIELRDDAVLKSPIHIVHLATGESMQVNSPRNFILMGKRAKASILEVYGHVNSGDYWTNATTFVSLAEGANLTHYKIQNEGAQAFHTGQCRVRQEQNSSFRSFSFSFGGKMGRNGLYVSLLGEGAYLSMDGLYLSHEGQHVDNHTIVDHVAPRASSHQYYKGILSEKSRAVFNGKIIVRRDAQQTDSSQLNKNLLLGSGAEIDTRPQLQIDADDVKCNHGASIGRMNPEELFYLQTRGLSPSQSSQLVCYGFAEDLVYKIEEPEIREEIQNLLSEAFAHESERLMDTFNVQDIRRDFPIIPREIRGKPLVYLDNAATTLKPKSVVDKLAQHYLMETSNIHRGVYFLSEKATEDYENVRKKVRDFIHAPSEQEIIFTRGTTESINLVAHSYGRKFLKAGDEIIISEMEHHSNIVPWQMLCEEKGCVLRVIPMDQNGDIIFDEFLKLIGPKTKFVSIVYISNSLGTVNPVKEIIRVAHEKGIPVLVDGAQAMATRPVDVQDLNCDFLAFSSHKMFGPTGVGVLYGKAELLNKMPPYQGGGDMIASVTFEKTLYNVLPYKFEAGTPPIAGVIGFGAAIDYINKIGFEQIQRYESELLGYATKKLLTVPGLKIIGTAKEKASIISFTLDGIHPHDIGTLVDQEGVAVRTGHHCTQPVMKHFAIPATARASFSIYNTKEDIDRLADALNKVIEVFK